MKSYTMRKMGDTLHRKLKILAAEKGISIQRTILEALERYVREEQKIKKGGENGDNKRHKNHED